MSRWIDNFKASPFQNQLEEYVLATNNLDESEITNPDILFEFARLRKALSYTESMFKLIDPELNSINALNNPNSQLTASFRSFSSNPLNLNVIQQANNQLDACLNSLKPLQTVLPTTPTKSLVSMLNAYDGAINKALKEIDLSKVKQDSQDIKSLKTELLDGEDSIKSEIDNTVYDIEKRHAEISATYEWLLEDGETDADTAIKAKIGAFYTHILSTADKAEEIDAELDKLHEFYEDIFGRPIKSDEAETSNRKPKKTIGLKAELAKRISDLDELKDAHKEKYDQLIDDIESLLPNATNAGLASAFNVERAKFESPIKSWNKLFICSLSIMFVVTVISFFNITLAPLGISYTGATSWSEALTEILHRLPLYGPLVWLAIYAGRRRSELQRLEQEYVHKEVFAKSYGSYKLQAENLENNDPLLARLLERSIDVIAHNASESLDRKQKDETPLNELIKVLLEVKSALKKLGDK